MNSQTSGKFAIFDQNSIYRTFSFYRIDTNGASLYAAPVSEEEKEEATV